MSSIPFEEHHDQHTTPRRGQAGSASFEVARIGYGAMQLDPESTSVEDAVAVLRRAVELGVNHIDTASFYSNGEVEPPDPSRTGALPRRRSSS